MRVAAGFALLNVVDLLQKKRRFVFVAVFIGIDIWLLLFFSQALQTRRPHLVNQIHNTETSLTKSTYQADAFASPNILDGASRIADATQVKIMRATVATSDGVEKAEHGIRQFISAAVRTAQHAVIAAIRAVAWAIAALFRAIGISLLAILRALGWMILFICKVIIFPFMMLGRGVAYAYGAVSEPINSQLSSVIQPQNAEADAPVITPEQAEQVTLIQENTQAVAPIKPAGTGGACDNGAGNGGYPMDWCDARMDTIRTVFYSSDRINRQCTSYAYWYFTTIEGHSDFRVSGNANRWARTSNYPVHAAPAVGSIAVQTSGVYGHVAIVQALPGEEYEGKVVPKGYILVSEMNYDWQGHFRYSYSPISKFSSYIYP